MEISLSSIVGAIVLISLVALTLQILNWVWFRPKRLERFLKKQGLKANPYRFLHGDLKESSKMRKEANSRPISLSDDFKNRIDPFNFQNIEKYGKNSFMWFGPTPRVNIMDPEQIKDVFNKINVFKKPSSNPLEKLLVSGLVSLEDEKWAKHRKIINPAFHVDKLKLMSPEFYRCSSEMISKWEGLISEDGWCELDVWPFLENLTRDVISRTAFGSSYEEGSLIFQLQKQQAELVYIASQSFYIPGWRFLPTKMNRRMMNIDKKIQSLLRGIVDKRVEAMKAGEPAKDDLLGILLESNMKEIRDHRNNKNVGMSIDDIIEECKIFYFAGQETTSVLLNWTMVLLSQNPTWQDRARAEVLQVFGDKKPNYEGINRLKIVTMILNEALRLNAPVVELLRNVYKETKLGNLTIPAGAQIAVPTAYVQHDPSLWGDDAKEFNPERFAEGVSKATKNQVSFLPFGWGPRICIGQNFAMIEAKLVLAMILQHFWFELSPTYAHAPFFSITVQPQYGTHIILHKC